MASFVDTLLHSLSQETPATGLCEKCYRARPLTQKYQIKHTPNILCLEFSLKDEVAPPIIMVEVVLKLTFLENKDIREWQAHHSNQTTSEKWIPARYALFWPATRGGGSRFTISNNHIVSSSKGKSWAILLSWKSQLPLTNHKTEKTFMNSPCVFHLVLFPLLLPTNRQILHQVGSLACV